jgi:hypothetical protein
VTRGSARRGFALLITITLLAFLVLLLVSLASLTRVETQVADNSQKFGLARQNAVFALSVALGQLQKYAGPDQRVTARADIGGGANLNGVAAPSDGKRQWTGVWGADTATTANTSSPVLLNWLVSGNETASFNANAGAPPYSGVTGIQFSSAGAIASLATGSQAVSALGTATEAYRLLVGANSAGADVSRYVAAPLVSITTPAGALPGFASTDTTPKTIGRYAWWVGDEGVKARANLYNPHLAGPAADLGSSFVVAQRSAVEFVDRAGSSTVLGGIYNPANPQLENAMTPSQMAFLASSAADATVTRDAMKERFHDVTGHSYSILADVRRGGLKKDLTRGLAVGAGGVGSPAAPADTDYLFAPNGTDTFGVPTWGQLRSFANRQVAAGGTVPAQAPTSTQIGIAPVLTYFGVGLDFSSPAFPPASLPPPQPLYLRIYPIAVLWNPYTVTLSAGDYVAGLMTRGDVLAELKTGTGQTTKGSLFLRRAGTGAGTLPPPVDFTHMSFRLRSAPIPPGQSMVFTLDPASPDGALYTVGQTALVPGLNPTRSVVMPFPAGVEITADDLANPISIVAGAGTETDCVLAEYSAATRPGGIDTPASFPRWYQAIQRVGPLGLQTPPMSNVSLNSDGAAGPRLAYRMQAGFSGAGSSALSNPTTGAEVQWIAHANFRAQLVVRTKLDSWLSGGSGPSTGINPSYSYRIDYTQGQQWPTFSTLDSRASAGRSLDNGGTPLDVFLWEFPVPQLGLLSLGQLQHANLSLLSAHAAYAVGSSLPDFRIPRADVLSTAGLAIPDPITTRINTHYDLSWHLNRSLWDRFFFSSVPTGAMPSATTIAAWTQANIDQGDPLPNSRIHYYWKDGASPRLSQLRHVSSEATSDPYNQAAANLLVAGGFNVNSTSVQAWRAVLAGVNQLAYNPQTRSAGAALQAAFSRFAVPVGGDSLATPWGGYRQLTEQQINQLAASIVAEVGRRGPFLSLADFVNRRLVAAGATGAETGLKGALQAAIDATTTGNAANLAATPPFNADLASGNLPGGNTIWDRDHMRNDTSNTSAAHRSRSAFAPKFLTQADVLSTLGPVLAARSDTFVIRTCGEAINPMLDETDAGYVTGRAWCEAVVQRVPDYMDPSMPPETELGTAPNSPAKTTNQSSGRRFKIISFRWLTPADI